MKVAISLPDDIYEEADRVAHRMQTSRSQLYSRALREFLQRHDQDHVTETMNRVCEEVGLEDDGFYRRAAWRVFEKDEW